MSLKQFWINCCYFFTGVLYIQTALHSSSHFKLLVFVGVTFHFNLFAIQHFLQWAPHIVHDFLLSIFPMYENNALPALHINPSLKSLKHMVVLSFRLQPMPSTFLHVYSKENPTDFNVTCPQISPVFRGLGLQPHHLAQSFSYKI